MAEALSVVLPKVVAIAQAAAEAIMPYHRQPELHQVQKKDDKSPVTAADFAANKVIMDGLQALAPWPIISEEAEIPDFAVRSQWQHYWLVDPLDGTKEFIAGTKDFTVNIALIEQHTPILGVIVLPTNQTCYTAVRGGVTQRQRPGQRPETIHCAVWDGERSLKMVASQRHDNKVVNRIQLQGVPCNIQRMGSSVKFCRIAEGDADCYTRLGPTSEWDTAAGQCIVEQAGGSVTNLEGEPLRYNTKNSLLNPHFMVMGDQRLAQLWR